ncbi:hypothetical protein CWE13_11345 [Aliidiomarina shirensis]|uniref:Transmembrane protein (PGPGW) n=1 Tax=Aliidiomarina shirensis TaxID=1048642 RepID=A0A432WP95_9GAMM|nr:hypothetical protein [Aliidiomarina shirensis]RUO35517.1 hypothetical protein CWE13_11345 [Aliidiomarina shirensis]
METFLERVSQIFASTMITMEPYLPLVAGVSIGMVLASMLIIPFLIIKMPADYFIDKRRKRNWTIPRIILYVLRNVFALVLFVAGVLMLVLPGQGLLTLIIAAVVSDFPGKFAFERWLLRQKGVLRSINWIRKRYDKPNIEVPEELKY